MCEFLTFNFKEISTDGEFDEKVEFENDFQVLKISKISKTIGASHLINLDWFKKQALRTSELVAIRFLIDEELNEKKIQNFQVYQFEKRILISYESTVKQHEQKLFWKLNGNEEEFYSLQLKNEPEEVKKFIWNLLFENLKNNCKGL